MAKITARKLMALVAPALLLTTLAGCGRTYQAAVPVTSARTAPVSAQGVAPDHEAVLAGDIRRAQYWASDAKLVMAIHATKLNTTAISASANVFYSEEAFLSGKTCVFVARHYGIRPIAQYTESPDYNRLAGRLAAIGAYTVKAQEAWRIAKTYQPDPGAGAANPAPSAAPTAAPVAPKPRFFMESRAFLIQPAKGDPEWHFYGANQLFTINAKSRAVAGPTPAINPNDRLNSGLEVDMERAAANWLPLGTGGDNSITEPQPTN
jgi:hypothetical protein